jgi:transposase InsO family protein
VFTFIEAEKASFPISFMCRHLGVSTSGYYAWRCRPPSPRAIADAELAERITVIHAESRGTYGAPRIHAELRLDHGVRCGRKRIARLMRRAGLEGVHRRRRQSLTRRDPQGEVSDDLVERNFRPEGPDRLWVADITQQRCWDGWLYVAVVIDAFSRRVVGWSMADHLRTELVLDALNMAVAHRRPTVEVVHHSDHGCQYTSLAFGRRLREARLARSMGSVGDCFDNAVAESFFATLECELLDRQSWPTRRDLSTAVFDFIEAFYNPRRRHSTLGYLSPANYEASWSDRPVPAA